MTYTIEQVQATAHQAVKQRGYDWRYPDEWRMKDDGSNSCRYLLPQVSPDDRGTPACIAGFIMRQLDRKATFYEGKGVESQPWYEDLDTEAAEYLERLQSVQDTGQSWGEALQTAEDSLEFWREHHGEGVA